MEEEASSTDSELKIGQSVHLSLQLYNDIKQKKSLFRILMKRLQHKGFLVSKLRILVDDLKSRIHNAQNDIPENEIAQLKREFHDKRRELRVTEVLIRQLLRRHYVLLVEISSLEKRRRKWKKTSSSSSSRIFRGYTTDEDDRSPGRSSAPPSTPPYLMVELRRCPNEICRQKLPTLTENPVNGVAAEPESLIDIAVKRYCYSNVKGVDGLDDESVDDDVLRGFPSSLSENLFIIKKAINDGKFTCKNRRNGVTNRRNDCKSSPDKTLHLQDENL